MKLIKAAAVPAVEVGKQTAEEKTGDETSHARRGRITRKSAVEDGRAHGLLEDGEGETQSFRIDSFSVVTVSCCCSLVSFLRLLLPLATTFQDGAQLAIVRLLCAGVRQDVIRFGDLQMRGRREETTRGRADVGSAGGAAEVFLVVADGIQSADARPRPAGPGPWSDVSSSTASGEDVGSCIILSKVRDEVLSASIRRMPRASGGYRGWRSPSLALCTCG